MNASSAPQHPAVLHLIGNIVYNHYWSTYYTVLSRNDANRTIVTIGTDAKGQPLLGAKPHERLAGDIWHRDVVIGWLLKGEFIARKDLPKRYHASGAERWATNQPTVSAGNPVTLTRDGVEVASRVASPFVTSLVEIQAAIVAEMAPQPGDRVAIRRGHTIAAAIEGVYVWTGDTFEPVDEDAIRHTMWMSEPEKSLAA